MGDDRHRPSMTILMTPDMSNFAGDVHGGTLLKYLDQVATPAQPGTPEITRSHCQWTRVSSRSRFMRGAGHIRSKCESHWADLDGGRMEC